MDNLVKIVDLDAATVTGALPRKTKLERANVTRPENKNKEDMAGSVRMR